MGRVKRYKKIKACDPFAKHSSKTVDVDNSHDDPLPSKKGLRRSGHMSNGEFWEDDFEEERALFSFAGAYRPDKNKKADGNRKKNTRSGTADEDMGGDDDAALLGGGLDRIEADLDAHARIMKEQMEAKDREAAGGADSGKQNKKNQKRKRGSGSDDGSDNNSDDDNQGRGRIATRGIDIFNDADEIANRREAQRVLQLQERYNNPQARSSSQAAHMAAISATENQEGKLSKSAATAPAGGRRPGESKYEYRIRCKEERRKLLRESLRKLTNSAQKKKAVLTEKKKAKKMKKLIKAGKVADPSKEPENEFFCSEKGHLRASDLGGIDNFKAYRPADVDTGASGTSGKNKKEKNKKRKTDGGADGATNSDSFVTITPDILATVSSGGKNLTKGNSKAFSLKDVAAVEQIVTTNKNRNNISSDGGGSYVPRTVALGITGSDLERPPDLRAFQGVLGAQKMKMQQRNAMMGAAEAAKAAALEAARKSAVEAYKLVREGRNKAAESAAANRAKENRLR